MEFIMEFPGVSKQPPTMKAAPQPAQAYTSQDTNSSPETAADSNTRRRETRRMYDRSIKARFNAMDEAALRTGIAVDGLPRERRLRTSNPVRGPRRLQVPTESNMTTPPVGPSSFSAVSQGVSYPGAHPMPEMNNAWVLDSSTSSSDRRSGYSSGLPPPTNGTDMMVAPSSTFPASHRRSDIELPTYPRGGFGQIDQASFSWVDQTGNQPGVGPLLDPGNRLAYDPALFFGPRTGLQTNPPLLLSNEMGLSSFHAWPTVPRVGPGVPYSQMPRFPQSASAMAMEPIALNTQVPQANVEADIDNAFREFIDTSETDLAWLDAYNPDDWVEDKGE